MAASVSSIQVWDQAVLKQGQFVMYEVTTRLYQGGCLRPDRYWKMLGPSEQSYKEYFSYDQRKVLIPFNELENYDIQVAAREFDISLHWAVQRKFCNLVKSQPLYKRLQTLVTMRNNICHRHDDSDISSSELTTRLEQLLQLCQEILEYLERKAEVDLEHIKKVVESNINKMIPNPPPGIMYTRSNQLSVYKDNGTARRSTTSRRTAEEDAILETLETFAIGVEIAKIGVNTVGALARHFSEPTGNDSGNRSPNNTSRNDEECSIM
ncbi:hypothetical protein OTU49_005228 [Cherax quadricarinatus]|uniref:Uncharacterized protein n=1 Tax=Cherax quadricarinatus TaxID=27406 RepID=A0AAW0WYQ6_CHEQU